MFIIQIKPVEIIAKIMTMTYMSPIIIYNFVDTLKFAEGSGQKKVFTFSKIDFSPARSHSIRIHGAIFRLCVLSG